MSDTKTVVYKRYYRDHPDALLPINYGGHASVPSTHYYWCDGRWWVLNRRGLSRMLGFSHSDELKYRFRGVIRRFDCVVGMGNRADRPDPDQRVRTHVCIPLDALEADSLVQGNERLSRYFSKAKEAVSVVRDRRAARAGRQATVVDTDDGALLPQLDQLSEALQRAEAQRDAYKEWYDTLRVIAGLPDGDDKKSRIERLLELALET